MCVCVTLVRVCVTPVFKVCLKPTGAEAETGEKEHRRLLPNRSSLHALSVFSHSGFSVYLLIHQHENASNNNNYEYNKDLMFF